MSNSIAPLTVKPDAHISWRRNVYASDGEFVGEFLVFQSGDVLFKPNFARASGFSYSDLRIIANALEAETR